MNEGGITPAGLQPKASISPVAQRAAPYNPGGLAKPKPANNASRFDYLNIKNESDSDVDNSRSMNQDEYDWGTPDDKVDAKNKEQTNDMTLGTKENLMSAIHIAEPAAKP